MYEYKSVVEDVYDGDTITISIDCGFGVWLHGQRVRLKGIDAPELKKGVPNDPGFAARDHLRTLIYGKLVIIETRKRNKCGMWLVNIWLPRLPAKKGIPIFKADGGNINNMMISSGHAVKKEY